MTTVIDQYDRLYENLKNRHTVVHENAEYTIGDYMRVQAAKRMNENTLPVAVNSARAGAITVFATYVNNKLTVKAPPVKDRTIKKFPFRASGSAVLSAVVACSLALSVGIVGARSLFTAPVADSAVVEYEADSEAEQEAHEEFFETH